MVLSLSHARLHIADFQVQHRRITIVVPAVVVTCQWLNPLSNRTLACR